MPNYFLANIKPEMKEALNRAGIIFMDFPIDNKPGLVIDQENIIEALKTMGINGVSGSEKDTEIPGIVSLAWKESNDVDYDPIYESIYGLDDESNQRHQRRRESERKGAGEDMRAQVSLEAPRGYECEHWENIAYHLVDDFNRRFNQKGISRLTFVESYKNKEDFRHQPKDGEVLVVLGAKPPNSITRQRYTHLCPGQRVIGFTGIPKCPQDYDRKSIVTQVMRYAEVICAETPELGEKLLSENKSYVDVSIMPDTSSTEKIRELLDKVLLPVVKTDIIIENHPNNWKALPPKGEEAFHIYFSSGPVNNDNYQRINSGKIFGLSSSYEHAFFDSGRGLSLVDENGIFVAELVNDGDSFNNLYIHVPLFYSSSSRNDIKILSIIIDWVVSKLSLSKKQLQQELDAPKAKLDCSSRSSDYNGRNQQLLALVNQILVPVVGKSTVLHTLSSFAAHPPQNDNFFHVWLAGSPNQGSSQAEEGGRSRPKKFYGYSVNGGWHGFTSSGLGIDINETDSGIPVAELIGDNLYIFYSLHHVNFNNGPEIFREILSQAAKMLKLDKSELAKHIDEAKRKRFSLSRENYVKACSRRYDSIKSEAINSAAKLEKKLIECQQALVTTIRDLEQAQKLAGFYNSNSDELNNKFRREFDVICQIPEIQAVQVTDQAIILTTSNIYLAAGGSGRREYFDIGQFKVEIFLSGGNGIVRFNNITRRGKGDNYNIHHPHVNESGHACWGNISDTVATLAASYEFSAIADLAIQFLKSVNYDGDAAGRAVFNCWPKVNKETYEKNMGPEI